MSTETQFTIPARYRKMENMHIVFWLFKDISWLMIWQTLGIAMIFPTLCIAILISWRTRHIKSELAHNLAVTFWIIANSFWMILEFFHLDSIIIWNSFSAKHISIIPFLLGMIVLAYYYFIQKPAERRTSQVATL